MLLMNRASILWCAPKPRSTPVDVQGGSLALVCRS